MPPMTPSIRSVRPGAGRSGGFMLDPYPPPSFRAEGARKLGGSEASVRPGSCSRGIRPLPGSAPTPTPAKLFKRGRVVPFSATVVQQQTPLHPDSAVEARSKASQFFILEPTKYLPFSQALWRQRAWGGAQGVPDHHPLLPLSRSSSSPHPPTPHPGPQNRTGVA